jgi:hypothetical protein
MADNVGLPLTGSGDSTASVAAEDIGGVHYQRVKIINAGAGSTAAASLTSTSVDVANTPTVLPGSGSSSVAPWSVDGLRFSSGQTSATTLATSAERELLAANANRRGAVIVNLSTAVNLLIGLTTNTVSTARANCHYIIPANSKLTIGGQLGDIPLYLGPVRGRLDSTTLAGVAATIQFSS